MNDRDLAKAKDLSEVLLARIPEDEDLVVTMVALGIVAGRLAEASRQPSALLPILSKIAHNVASGDWRSEEPVRGLI